MDPVPFRIPIQEEKLERELSYTLKKLKGEGIITQSSGDTFQKLMITLRAIFDTVIQPKISADMHAIIEHIRHLLERILPKESVSCIMKSLEENCVPSIAMPESMMDTDGASVRSNIKFDTSRLPSGRYVMYPATFVRNRYILDGEDERQTRDSFESLLRVSQLIQIFEDRFGEGILPLPTALHSSRRLLISNQPLFHCIRDASDRLNEVLPWLESIAQRQRIVLGETPLTDLTRWMQTPIEITVEKSRSNFREKIIITLLLAGTLATGIVIGMSLAQKPPDRGIDASPPKNIDK